MTAPLKAPALVLLTSLLVVGWGGAAPGDLDPTFGNNGLVTTSLAAGDSLALKVVQQADGKLLAAGYHQNGSVVNFALARYLPDGTLDSSFNLNGKALVDFGGYDFVSAAALQSDQKILVVGTSYYPTGPSQLTLSRFRTDGTLDPSFQGGFLSIPSVDGKAVAEQSDGKVVVAGNSGTEVFVFRFNPDGTSDASFGVGGRVVTSLGGATAQISALALQADGKIVVAGYANTSGITDALVVRYETNGTLDPTFNGTGKLVRDLGATYEIIESIAIQADHKIVLAGYGSDPNTKLLLARVNVDGSLDSTFNGTGIVSTSLSPKIGIGHGLALQPDGKILLAGATGAVSPPNAFDFVLARYLPNGSPDLGFSPNGRVVTSFGSDDDTAWGVVLQGDGKIVAAGVATVAGSRRFALARYVGNDTATEVPTLLSPASGASSINEIPVSFHLPEPAQTSTVTLTFAGVVTRSFTLAPAMEGAGSHQFSLNALNPLESASVLTGSPIPDGTYSVTLSYQDSLGNPAAVSAAATGVAVNLDTDGDGILDRYETGTGVYVSPQDTGTSPTNSDSDGDGLSDGQEVTLHGTNPNLADTDGDGFNDGFEVSTGFDPKSAASSPDAVSSIRTAVEYRFNAADGVSYRIEVSPDLVNWSTLESPIVGIGGVVTRFYSIQGQAVKFYRARRN